MITQLLDNTQTMPSVKLPQENVVTVYLNNKLLITLMATPSQIKELVFGFLYLENIIGSVEEITGISVNQDKRRAQVWVQSNIENTILQSRIRTSGCGQGFTFLCPSELEEMPPLKSTTKISKDEIIKLMREIGLKAKLYRLTGGIHAAALCDTHNIISFSEDIGRHNTVDKVIGDCLIRGILTEGKIILTTGRISSEMLCKAFKANIPVLCSRTSPTELAVQLGDKLKITIIGYARANRINAYTHSERIII
ncbi:MAG: formate dehydrogenase accessory sulfurtransferase FdhD [Planctomycetota bacterium]